AFAPTMGASVSLGVTGLMKAAFGLRAVFFFAVFFAMRSPMKTHNASRESTTKMTTFPLGNPSNSPHDGASRPQDPVQDALRDELRHPRAGARHRGQYGDLLGVRSTAPPPAAGACPRPTRESRSAPAQARKYLL